MSDMNPQSAGGVSRPGALEVVTPPRSPAPMPRQVMTFWTPRLAFAAMLRGLKGLRRSLRTARRAATVPVPNFDEQR